MGESPNHPITTPKGAGVLTLLLAVISVFAPFLFNLGSALFFGVVAIIVIGWIYWSEARTAISERRWSQHLNIPVAAVIIIIAVGALSARNVYLRRKPAALPVAAISAEDVASRVMTMIRQNQPPATAPAVVTVPGRTIVVRVPAPTPPSPQALAPVVAARESVKLPPPPKPVAQTDLPGPVDVCPVDRFVIVAGLSQLIVQAANAQTSFSSTHNDIKIAADYKEWMAKSHLFFDAHVDQGLDSGAFYRAHGSRWPKTFLLIHDSGLMV